MKKTAYLAIAFITFIAVITAFIPASMIVIVAGDELSKAAPDLKIGKLSGTIWRGETDLQFLDLPQVHTQWKLLPIPFILRTLSIKADITGTGILVDFKGEFSSQTGTLNPLNAEITSEYINQMTLEHGLDLSGTFDLQNASVAFDNEWITKLAGNLIWSGGIVHIETPQQIYSSNLPSLTGVFSLAGKNIILDVSSSTENLMQITLKPDGWAVASISYAFMSLANLPVPGAINESEPAIILEEKILQGTSD